MKSSHKMVVTGAFSGLGAVVIAGSAAFACTADAGIGVFKADAMQTVATVAPGEKLTVKASSFMPATVAKDSSGKEIVVNGERQYIDRRDIIVTLTSPYTGQVVFRGQYPGPEATFEVTMPADAYFTEWNQPYLLTAQQPGYYARSSRIFVPGGQRYQASQTKIGTGVATEQPVGSAPAGGITVTGGITDTAPAQGVVAAPPGSGSTAAVPAAAAGTPPAGEPGGAVAGLTTPVDAAVAPASPVVPPENTAPPAGELWSGLQAGSSANLLDPASGLTPPADGIPAGAAGLLGLGMLSLAGVAFEATRRRLVLSRVTRRH